MVVFSMVTVPRAKC